MKRVCVCLFFSIFLRFTNKELNHLKGIFNEILSLLQSVILILIDSPIMEKM